MTFPSEDRLKEIVTLAETLPERYRESCFELLLSSLLSPQPPSEIAQQPPAKPPESQVQEAAPPFVMPIDVKAFLSQYGIQEDALWKGFIASGSDIRPTYKLQTTKKAEAQIQSALMMSLEVALITGRFEVTIEDLRKRCTDEKTYDSPNFMRNLKAKENLFKAVDEVSVLTLSPDGKSELAELLESLTA